MSNNTPAIGGLIPIDDVDKVAAALYRRFYYEYGRLQWNDDRMENFRAKFRKQVREVLDALEMEGMSIQRPGRPEEAMKMFTHCPPGGRVETVPPSEG